VTKPVIGSRRGHQCSETTLTGESRFHISPPQGIWTWVPYGSTQVVYWTSETWWESCEIAGFPQILNWPNTATHCEKPESAQWPAALSSSCAVADSALQIMNSTPPKPIIRCGPQLLNDLKSRIFQRTRGHTRKRCRLWIRGSCEVRFMNKNRGPKFRETIPLNSDFPPYKLLEPFS
jgi:hypothetical protein